MKINRDASPSSDKLVAPSITVNSGATLTVANIGSTNLVAGGTFTLFSTPISGAFSTVTLPALPGANEFWTNNLAVNGSIAVVTAVTVNPNSTNITASGTVNFLPAETMNRVLRAFFKRVAMPPIPGRLRGDKFIHSTAKSAILNHPK